MGHKRQGYKPFLHGDPKAKPAADHARECTRESRSGASAYQSFSTASDALTSRVPGYTVGTNRDNRLRASVPVFQNCIHFILILGPTDHCRP